MGQYPFEWQVPDLCPEDFIHFQQQFSKTILQLIPFAVGPVIFFDAAHDFIDDIIELNKPKYWSQYLKRVLRRQRSVLAAKRPILFLPVWNAESIIGIAVVEGVDKQFANALSEEWLSDRSRIISREFFLQKQLAYEPVTGMFNNQHLQDKLESLLTQIQRIQAGGKKHDGGKNTLNKISLLLIETYPRANNAEKALNYIVRAGYYLESFLGQDVLHHMGNGIFGFIGEGLDEEQAQKLGKKILSWCRREGFHRIHIGINTVEAIGDTTTAGSENQPDCHTLIRQTWKSLRKASRRGPYALCTYSSISKPEAHPLQKTKPAVSAKLRKLWAGIDSFALLLVSQDRELQGEVFPKRLLALIEPRAEAVPISVNETFVFLKDADEKKALSWARDLKKKMNHDLGTTYSIGIACYPCIDFKKSDIPQNGRKALLHAGFFGPDTTVAFDGISQNVSGDIYYNEGDLVRAVKEYRKGLEIDPENCNLLNSIGEAYAQMGKPQRARPFFEDILNSKPKHYMGLFNLGIINLSLGEDEQAIACFEKALVISRRSPEVNQKNDLLLQLSKLYCRNGKYKKAVNLLVKEKIIDAPCCVTPGGNVLLRYLGEAYFGIGKKDQAIMVLQRAVSHNPHDASSLSMLGELYALENQGDDIALSLCTEAVNIDDRHWKHWYRLAWVRCRMAQYEAALEALQECMLREPKSAEVLFLAGKVYEELGVTSRATVMFKKVLKIVPKHKSATAALKKMTN